MNFSILKMVNLMHLAIPILRVVLACQVWTQWLSVISASAIGSAAAASVPGRILRRFVYIGRLLGIQILKLAVYVGCLCHEWAYVGTYINISRNMYNIYILHLQAYVQYILYIITHKYIITLLNNFCSPSLSLSLSMNVYMCPFSNPCIPVPRCHWKVKSGERTQRLNMKIIMSYRNAGMGYANIKPSWSRSCIFTYLQKICTNATFSLFNFSFFLTKIVFNSISTPGVITSV